MTTARAAGGRVAPRIVLVARPALVAGLALALAALLLVPIAGRAAPPTEHYWYDGTVRRPLWLENAQVADFSTPGPEASKVLRPAGLRSAAASKQAAASAADSTAGGDGLSPVFKDGADAGARLRALPGGVIVTLKQPLADPQARQFFKARGLVAVRPVVAGSGMWLIESRAGLDSLTLANRLHEGGEFAAASPNWWQPRTLK